VSLTEGINTELKSEFTNEIKKTAVAFANTKGGKIYIGVEDDGAIVGVEDIDSVIRQVTDSIRDSIKPDVTRFMNVYSENIADKTVVVAQIERGVYCPYYIAERGLKPSGVYIRAGNASVPATEEHIRQMIKEADGERYITSRSLIQDLSFERTQKEFDEKGIAFGDSNKITLGIIGDNGIFTNLGLLLSEQCQHTTKVAIFEGNTKAVFKSRKEFTGSLMRQLYEAIEYLDYFNLVRAEIGKIYRTESRDYPVDAIREAYLNALIHREYGLSASTFVNVYDNRMEFLSVGGLVPGITLDAILSGVSHTRNEKLANIFYRLEIVEAYGTGIMRIMNDYANCQSKPEINVTDSSFMMTLPNMRYHNKAELKQVNEQESEVLRIIERDGYVTSEILSNALNLGATRSYNILKKMADSGNLKTVKNGRKIEYRLTY
jgi:ATP-dependent DNA helicase RecG